MSDKSETNSSSDDDSYHIKLPPIDDSEDSEDSENEEKVNNPNVFGLTQGTFNAVEGLLNFAKKPPQQNVLKTVPEVEELLVRQCDPIEPLPAFSQNNIRLQYKIHMLDF